MDISALITPDRVIANLTARTKPRVLQELSRKAATMLSLDSEYVFNAIMAREKLGSTGVGMGTAVPHARLAGVKSPCAIFARLAHSIDYESVDGTPVDLVYFLLLSPGEDKENLVLLADVAKRLRAPDFRAKLRAMRDGDELHQVVVGWKPSDSAGTRRHSIVRE